MSAMSLERRSTNLHCKRLVFLCIFEKAIQESKEGTLTSPIDYAADKPSPLTHPMSFLSFDF
jgi:hypothetical protein